MALRPPCWPNYECSPFCNQAGTGLVRAGEHAADRDHIVRPIGSTVDLHGECRAVVPARTTG